MNGVHHLTVDVEEFFHSTLLADRVPPGRWSELARRAPVVVDWLLEAMEARGVRATFFVLGWLAEREPGLVRRIVAAGHELGAHSWMHRPVTSLEPGEFRDAVRRSRALLEDVGGVDVVGYRAPSFSIRPGAEWALDILVEEGYRYDSSLFPIRVHPGYGYPDVPAVPSWIHRPSGRLLEVPPLTLELAGRRLPAAGGGYLRLLPHRLVRSALAQSAERGVPGTLYVHPWDLDPGGERLPLPPLLRLRLYGGRARARRGVLRLMDEHRFVPVRETLERMEREGVAS